MVNMVTSKQLKDRLKKTLHYKLSRKEFGQLGYVIPDLVDFSSSDYLGFARDGSPFRDFLEKTESLEKVKLSTSSTGCRLLSGNSDAVLQLERTAAEFHGTEAALVFNSGYDANLSLFSSLPGRDDVLVYDQLVHASIHDGMRLGRGATNSIPFAHNDVAAMRRAVNKASTKYAGSILVCVESIYSMDGDVAPLEEMLEECRALSFELQQDVLMIVDEAHSGGLFGENGEGMVTSQNFHKHPNHLATVITYGKGFGAHGAVVLGPQVLIQYLTNYGRSFAYSTALPPHAVAVLCEAYRFAMTDEAKQARKTLWDRVEFFNKVAQKHLPSSVLLKCEGKSALKVFCVPGVREVHRVNTELVKRGYETYAINSPAVKEGEERIRVVLHAHNTEEEIEGLIAAAAEVISRRPARY